MNLILEITKIKLVLVEMIIINNNIDKNNNI